MPRTKREKGVTKISKEAETITTPKDEEESMKMSEEKKMTLDSLDTTSTFKEPDRFIVNVSGRKFELSHMLWRNIWNNVAPMEKEKIPTTTKTDIFIERHAGSFESILYYYQCGRLHMPADICPSTFQAELQFWGVDPLAMSKCCYSKYVTYFDDEQMLMIMENDQINRETERRNLVRMSTGRGWPALQAKVWLILEEPFYSYAAKAYFFITAVVVMISICTLVMGTHPEFHRSLNEEEWREYLGTEFQKYAHHFGIATAEAESTTEAESSAEPLPNAENLSVRFDAFEYIEYMCVAFFTLDLLVRIIFCPSKFKLLVSFLNWVDIFALAVMYIKYLVEELRPREKYESSFLDIVHCLQIVRVFRLFRLVKNFIGFRVLLYAFKASVKEMFLMSLFLVAAMLLFSAFAFFSGDENFPSIPDAFWWSIITMTTVGYGDMVPSSALAKVIGVFCALSGVCLLAVIIPIFVNNFIMFYSYSKIWGRKSTTNEPQNNINKVGEIPEYKTFNGVQQIKTIDTIKIESLDIPEKLNLHEG